MKMWPQKQAQSAVTMFTCHSRITRTMAILANSILVLSRTPVRENFSLFEFCSTLDQPTPGLCHRKRLTICHLQLLTVSSKCLTLNFLSAALFTNLMKLISTSLRSRLEAG